MTVKTPSRKAKLETVGAAYELQQKWQKESRAPTAAEQSAFNSLLDDAENVLGVDDIPRQAAAFTTFAKAVLSSDDGRLAAAEHAMNQGGGNPPNPFASSGNGSKSPGGSKLYDANGHVTRGLALNESFADAVSERPRLAGGSDEDTGEKLVNDGLTLGGLLRAAAIGPKHAAERFALNSGGSASGGFMAPDYLAAMLIDRFRPQVRLMQMGAQTIPLQGSSHRFVRLESDPTAGWRREGQTITESEPTFGAITFHPKSLSVIVRCTRELLQDAPNITSAIERSLSAAFATEVDRVGMLGEGSDEPTGIINHEGINEQASVGTPDSWDEVLQAYKLLLDDNVPDPTGLIMSPREWLTYASLADTTGQPLRKPQAINDLPMASTSAVPTTLGGGAESVMFMGYFPDFLIGIRAELQVEVLKELYAQTGEIGFAAHMRMDTHAYHAESLCKLTGVTNT